MNEEELEICHIFLWENRDKIFLNRVSLETPQNMHTPTHQRQSSLYRKNQRICVLGSLIIINLSNKEQILLQPQFSHGFLETLIWQKFCAPKSSLDLKGKDNFLKKCN